MDFLDDSVVAISARVRSSELSAREVVTHSIERIETLNPSLNAFVAWDADRALAQASALDDRIAAGDDAGPLAGIPVGVKDLEDAVGFPTSLGSALYAGTPAKTSDSILVGRLRSAGAVIMGKTNTPEYGHKGVTDNIPFGPTRNPWSLDHTPGGSSGGTAAAIASGMIPLGTGSDGGGSIRIPASLCGLTGIKPETGRIPIAGRAMPGSGLLSANGPMGRTAHDSAVALDAVRGRAGRDPLSHQDDGRSWADAVARAQAPSRVIWSPTMGYADVAPGVLARCQQAVDALASAGTEIIEIDTVFPYDPIEPWIVLWVVARFKAQGHLMNTPDWAHVSDSIKPQIEAGANVTAADYARAHDAIYELNWLLETAFDDGGADLILCPTTASHPPALAELGVDPQADVGWVAFTYGINMTRNPAGTTCAAHNDAGLPIGLQIIGRHHGEASVLEALAVVEGLVGLDRRPPVS